MFEFLSKLFQPPKEKPPQSFLFVKGLCETSTSNPRFHTKWALESTFQVSFMLNEIEVSVSYDTNRREYSCTLYCPRTRGYLFSYNVHPKAIEFLLDRFDLNNRFFEPAKEERGIQTKKQEIEEQKLIDKYMK